MEAMEPPGTYSIKMFTTPPSKQVPMNLRVTVRKSFKMTNNRTAYITKFMFMVIYKNGRRLSLSRPEGFTSVAFVLVPSLKNTPKYRQDFDAFGSLKF